MELVQIEFRLKQVRRATDVDHACKYNYLWRQGSLGFAFVGDGDSAQRIELIQKRFELIFRKHWGFPYV